MRRPALIADLVLISISLIWGFNFAIMKVSFAHFNPLTFTVLRFLVAVPVLLLFARAVGVPLKIERADIPVVIGLGLLSNTVYQTLFVFGLDNSRAGNAGLLLATTPVFAYCTAVLLRWERFSGKMAAGIALSVAGAFALVLSAGTFSFGGFGWGDLLLLSAAMCWGAYTGYAAKWVAKYGALRLTVWVMAAGAAGLLPVFAPLAVRQDWRAIPPYAWGAFLFSAFFAIAYCYIGWSYALKHVGIGRTVAFSNLTPLVALLGGWLMLGERPVVAQIAGAALILTGVLIVRSPRRS
jgi:drug/metabolite transporter (DMT)-like permease